MLWSIALGTSSPNSYNSFVKNLKICSKPCKDKKDMLPTGEHKCAIWITAVMPGVLYVPSTDSTRSSVHNHFHLMRFLTCTWRGSSALTLAVICNTPVANMWYSTSVLYRPLEIRGDLGRLIWTVIRVLSGNNAKAGTRMLVDTPYHTMYVAEFQNRIE